MEQILILVVLGKWVCFLDFEYKFVQTMAIGIANFLSANQLKVKFKTFMILGFKYCFFKSDSPYYIHSCWAFFIRYIKLVGTILQQWLDQMFMGPKVAF